MRLFPAHIVARAALAGPYLTLVTSIEAAQSAAYDRCFSASGHEPPPRWQEQVRTMTLNHRAYASGSPVAAINLASVVAAQASAQYVLTVWALHGAHQLKMKSLNPRAVMPAMKISP